LEGRECRVAVGSTNPVKVGAVARVFRLLCSPTVIPVAVEPGVPPQPVGLGETLRGALNRAVGALRGSGADYGVGMEAGVVRLGEGLVLDVQACVVIDSSGRVGVGLSPWFQVPGGWAGRLLEGVELGVVAEEVLRRVGIRSGLGVIGYLTRGFMTRLELGEDALLMALVPFMNPRLYGDSMLTVDALLGVIEGLEAEGK